jgi:hypothetical protein
MYGYFDWKIPTDYQPGDYKFEITAHNSKGKTATFDSPTFTIVPTPPPPPPSYPFSVTDIKQQSNSVTVTAMNIGTSPLIYCSIGLTIKLNDSSGKIVLDYSDMVVLMVQPGGSESEPLKSAALNPGGSKQLTFPYNFDSAKKYYLLAKSSCGGDDSTKELTVYPTASPSTTQAQIALTNPVKVISPNGYEKYQQGEYITIKWQGGKDIVQIGVTTKDAGYSNNGFTGLLGWVDTHNISDGQKVWNGKTICDLQMGSCHDLAPGQYRIIAVSKSLYGNLIFGADGPNGDTANFDLSDGYFNISAAVPYQANSPTIVSPTLTQINDNASQLYNGNTDSLLAQINQLRSTIAEQASQIKYLASLIKDVPQVSQATLDAINNFITYGVDQNTVKLGAGQRAAVVNSFKSAFDRLPTSQTDITDVVKIANGRWPSQTSPTAIADAKVNFKKVYLRDADMNNANDNAAITIMAYGLQQQAQNRNLNSEKVGIRTFKYIYGRLPSSAQDWNVVAAITYSGATR